MRELAPTPLERWLEDRLPGYRYGFVLVLLFTTYIFMASGPSHELARVVTTALQSVTLLATLIASRVGRRLFRISAVIVGLTFVTALGSVFVSTSPTPSGAFFASDALLVVACPVVISTALLQRRTVDLHTVFGALCIYVLIGMMFAFVYAAIGYIGNDPFFVQTKQATIPDFLYFSFVTQTTVGYGDLSAAGDLGRALSAFEAMIGQLYLVTVVAVVVSHMSGARRRNDGASDGQADDNTDDPSAEPADEDR